MIFHLLYSCRLGNQDFGYMEEFSMKLPPLQFALITNEHKPSWGLQCFFRKLQSIYWVSSDFAWLNPKIIQFHMKGTDLWIWFWPTSFDLTAWRWVGSNQWCNLFSFLSFLFLVLVSSVNCPINILGQSNVMVLPCHYLLHCIIVVVQKPQFPVICDTINLTLPPLITMTLLVMIVRTCLPGSMFWFIDIIGFVSGSRSSKFSTWLPDLHQITNVSCRHG